ncbi:hypothetical protein FHG87_017564, partial [Trinorchestia longiramus]
MPVWDRPERQDVGSFPDEELGPPSKLKCISMNPSDVARTVDEVFGHKSDVEMHKSDADLSFVDQNSTESGPPPWGGNTISIENSPGSQLSINKRTGSLQRSNVARRTSIVTSADHNMPYQVPVIQVTPSSCPTSSTPSCRSASSSPVPRS